MTFIGNACLVIEMVHKRVLTRFEAIDVCSHLIYRLELLARDSLSLAKQHSASMHQLSTTIIVMHSIGFILQLERVTYPPPALSLAVLFSRSLHP